MSEKKLIPHLATKGTEVFKIQIFKKFHSNYGNSPPQHDVWVDFGQMVYGSADEAENHIKVNFIERQGWVSDKFRVVPA